MEAGRGALARAGGEAPVEPREARRYLVDRVLPRNLRAAGLGDAPAQSCVEEQRRDRIGHRIDAAGGTASAVVPASRWEASGPGAVATTGTPAYMA